MFSEMSEVFFSCHLKRKKNNSVDDSVTANVDISYKIDFESQEVTTQRLGRKIVHMKSSSKKNTPKTSHQGKINI